MLSCILFVRNKPNLLSIDRDISGPTRPETLPPLGAIVENKANLSRTGGTGRQVARPDYAKQSQLPSSEGCDKYFAGKGLWLIAHMRGPTKQSQFADPDADRVAPNKANLLCTERKRDAGWQGRRHCRRWGQLWKTKPICPGREGLADRWHGPIMRNKANLHGVKIATSTLRERDYGELLA
jgi:hypothetical protein